jgi:hypothetical protein
MLDKYRTKSPTITEKLALPRAPKETAEVVAEKVRGTKAFLGEWQVSWEKKGWFDDH